MRRLITLIALSAMAGLGGCSDGSDCKSYCEKMAECWSADLDVDECTSTCETYADESQDNADKAAECADCVVGRSCAEALEQCIDDCLGVRTR